MFVLPIIGTFLLGSVAVAEWYGGNKIRAIWFGLAGVFCILVVVAILWTQAILADGATGAEAKLVNRPTIGVDNINSVVQAGQKLSAVIIWKNTGSIPALNARSYVRGKSVPKGIEPPAFSSEADNNGPPGVLLPGSVSSCPLSDGPILTQGNIDAINKGDVSLWVVGRIDYSDDNGAKYFMAFRAEYNVSGRIWEFVGYEFR